MQRPRLRLGLWWLMAAIAAIGLFLGAWIEVPRLRELSRDYRRRANEYAWREQQARAEWKSQVECLAYWSALATEREKEAGAIDSPGRSDGEPHAVESPAERVTRTKEQVGWHAREAALWEGRATHHGRMRRKWQPSAVFPWLPVEPDPPAPGS